MVDCFKRQYPVQAPPQDATQPPTYPTYPTISEAETLYPELSNDSDARAVVAPDLISKYEMNFWYHGVSGDPPKLIWRSDLETNPFPIPPPGTNFFKIPTKAAHSVFNTPLNDMWDNTAPRILELMKPTASSTPRSRRLASRPLRTGTKLSAPSLCGSPFVQTPPMPGPFAMPRQASSISLLMSISPMSSNGTRRRLLGW